MTSCRIEVSKQEPKDEVVLHRSIRFHEGHGRLEPFGHHGVDRVGSDSRSGEVEESRKGHGLRLRGHGIPRPDIDLNRDPYLSQLRYELHADTAIDDTFANLAGSEDTGENQLSNLDIPFPRTLDHHNSDTQQ